MNNQEAHIFHLMNVLKEESQCLDKQVVCIITDKRYSILSYGVNFVDECNQKCDDKENRICNVRHAEAMAIDNLRSGYMPAVVHYAFVNLFPCVSCQELFKSTGIKEIIVAGPRHKGQIFKNIRLESDLYKSLLLENGKEKQLSVIQGELAELITMISDYFYRPNKKIPIKEMVDEIIDVELMLMQLKMICWKGDPLFYNLLRHIRASKHITLLDKIVKRLL